MNKNSNVLTTIEAGLLEQSLLESINRIKDGNGIEAILCIAQALSMLDGKQGVTGNKNSLLELLPKQLKDQMKLNYGLTGIGSRIPPSILFEIFRISSSSDCLEKLKEDDGEIALNTIYLSALNGEAGRVKEAFGFLNETAKDIFSPGFKTWINLINED